MSEKTENQQKTEELMKAMADTVSECLKTATGQKIGFALLVFDFGNPGYANYITNANRKSMVEALKETAERIGQSQDAENESIH